MTADKPQDPLGMSITVERDRAIEVLSRQFAEDVISLEELERRIEGVYKAQTISAVRDLTRDLPTDAVPRDKRNVPVPSAFAPENGRIFSMMAETVRRGVWQPARLTRVVSIMSETHLDLTQARLSPGITEIDLWGLMTQIKVIVPAGVRVVVQPSAFMAQVSDETDDPPAVGSGAPVVRITGFVMMAELKVSVRTRERTSSDELLDDGL